MKLLIITTVLFMCVVFDTAYGSESWRCTEEGITREGNVFVSCGMGEGWQESTARDNAFLTAKSEFQELCKMDYQCKDRKISVDPGRTTCEKIGHHDYRCYRLIRFTIVK